MHSRPRPPYHVSRRSWVMIRANSCLDGFVSPLSAVCCAMFPALRACEQKEIQSVKPPSAFVWRLIRLPVSVNRSKQVHLQQFFIQVPRLAASKALVAVCFPANLFSSHPPDEAVFRKSRSKRVNNRQLRTSRTLNIQLIRPSFAQRDDNALSLHGPSFLSRCRATRSVSGSWYWDGNKQDLAPKFEAFGALLGLPPATVYALLSN
ncbi:hypothetical protein BDV11DRAFT_75217 [Aspergillus similis]